MKEFHLPPGFFFIVAPDIKKTLGEWHILGRNSPFPLCGAQAYTVKECAVSITLPRIENLCVGCLNHVDADEIKTLVAMAIMESGTVVREAQLPRVARPRTW